MKLLNDLVLQFEKPLWALNPELAEIDTILESHVEIYTIVKDEITRGEKNNDLGRGDRPTVEQVVRGALYKEIKKLSYRELEYEQYDSKICEVFLKLKGRRKAFSHEVLHKYISRISCESLHKVMVEINKLAIAEEIEDGGKVRSDSTVVETNIHYPTNNSLTWDCIKDIHRILKSLKETGVKVRTYQKQAKKNYYRINNTKSKHKRQEEFKKQLKLFRSSINQAQRIIEELSLKSNLQLQQEVLLESLKQLLPKAEKVYDITYRHELLGQKVPNEDKIFSIYEDHTDIIVKGGREVKFGHKINISSGKSNLILDCQILDGNPKDSTLYGGTLERIEKNYGIIPLDMVTDGGYASLRNVELAKEKGIVNIVFNKIVGSLTNMVTSKNIETRLKRWRSGIEAVISNIKRGYDLFRCQWRTKFRYDAKVLWSVIAYNIRVLTGHLLCKMEAQLQ